jgi:competence protein ComEC
VGCVGDLPEGQSLSLVIDRTAFEEDCERAAIVVSALTAPVNCGAPQVFDEKRLAQTGAVGLIWDGKQFAIASDRSTEQDRPWSPAPKRLRADRVVRPGAGAATTGVDPADPTTEQSDPP